MRFEILLVDDDHMIRQVVAEEIEEAGHFVATAGSGAAALAILAGNPAFDLVLVDYSMPDMTGIEIIRLIRANLPDLKARFALFTAYDEIPEGQDLSKFLPEPLPLIAKATRSAELIKGVEHAALGEPMGFSHDAKMSRVERLFEQIDAEQEPDEPKTGI